MIIAAVIVLVIAVTLLFGIFYMVFRNNKVYRYRVDLIERDNDAYKNLPSYDKMLYSFKSLTDENWAPNVKNNKL